MNTWITIAGSQDFNSAFGDIGSKVGPRTGPNKRTKDKKEWYVVRRFLKEAIATKVFQPPLRIRKGEPPKPDFELECEGDLVLIDITEASDEADQREMTALESSDRNASLLGEHGGRFAEGGGEPGYAWAADVIEAVERKTKKGDFLATYKQPSTPN